jgi:putative transposase
MIDKTHALSIVAQCRLLDISRGCVYYRPVAIAPQELCLMRRLDELHLQYPFFGSRRLLVKLREEGFDLGRRHLVTLGEDIRHARFDNFRSARGRQN